MIVRRYDESIFWSLPNCFFQQKDMRLYKSLDTVVCKKVHKIWSVWCKMALGEVGVSLPWWCHAFVLLVPGYWRLFLNLKPLVHNGKLTNFKGILGQGWNSEVSAILPYEFQSFNFDLKFLCNWSFFHNEPKVLDLKKVFSNLEPEWQGRGIIKGVTRLLLIGPFYTIQINFMYVLFCTRL